MKQFKVICLWFCMTAMAYAFPIIGGAADWTWQNPLPQGNSFNDVWGTGSDVFVVGDYGTIFHYDGSAWTEMSSGTTEYLQSVWGSSGSDVFVVGSKGTILHYNGSVWSEMNSGTTNGLGGVWGQFRIRYFCRGWFRHNNSL